MVSSSSSHGWSRLRIFACPMQYYYQEVLGLERPTSYELLLGICYHAVLAEYARQLNDGYEGDIVASFCQAWQEGVAEAPHLAIEECRARDDMARMLAAYVERFPEPEPFKYRYIECEHAMQLSEENRFSGRLDGIVQLAGDLYILEHKTTNWNPGKFYEAFETDKQITGYIVLAENLLTEPVKGAIIRVCYKGGRGKEPKPVCYEERFSRSPAQKEAWKREIQCIFKQIEYMKQSAEWYCLEGVCHQYGRCAHQELCKHPDQDPLTLWIAAGGKIRKEEVK